MRNRILIPLDGSEFSRQILGCLAPLFPPPQNELILLRVAQPPAGRSPALKHPVHRTVPVKVYESMHDVTYAHHPIYASQELASLSAALRDQLEEEAKPLRQAGYTVTIEIRWRDPAKEIVRFVKEERIDAVAMVTHQRSGLSRLLRASVAQSVLGRLSVPILLLHPGCA